MPFFETVGLKGAKASLQASLNPCQSLGWIVLLPWALGTSLINSAWDQ